MSGPIEIGWKSYLKAVVNPLNSPEQIAEMRRVFYAGAMISFVAIVGDADDTEAQGLVSLYVLKCRTGVPFHMKQMSGRTKEQLHAIPADLMIREFPNVDESLVHRSSQ